jgi:hypothetical protein
MQSLQDFYHLAGTDRESPSERRGRSKISQKATKQTHERKGISSISSLAPRTNLLKKTKAPRSNKEGKILFWQ